MSAPTGGGGSSSASPLTSTCVVGPTSATPPTSATLWPGNRPPVLDRHGVGLMLAENRTDILLDSHQPSRQGKLLIEPTDPGVEHGQAIAPHAQRGVPSGPQPGINTTNNRIHAPVVLPARGTISLPGPPPLEFHPIPSHTSLPVRANDSPQPHTEMRGRKVTAYTTVPMTYRSSEPRAPATGGQTPR